MCIFNICLFTGHSLFLIVSTSTFRACGRCERAWFTFSNSRSTRPGSKSLSLPPPLSSPTHLPPPIILHNTRLGKSIVSVIFTTYQLYPMDTVTDVPSLCPRLRNTYILHRKYGKGVPPIVRTNMRVMCTYLRRFRATTVRSQENRRRQPVTRDIIIRRNSPLAQKQNIRSYLTRRLLPMNTNCLLGGTERVAVDGGTGHKLSRTEINNLT